MRDGKQEEGDEGGGKIQTVSQVVMEEVNEGTVKLVFLLVSVFVEGGTFILGNVDLNDCNAHEYFLDYYVLFSSSSCCFYR